MRPTQFPNPTRSPGLPHEPRMVTVSPSLRNRRTSIPYKRTSFFPPSLISNRLPLWFGPGPLIVPEPSKSPVLIGQPPRVWWAIIWGNDHNRYSELEVLMVVTSPEGATHKTMVRAWKHSTR